MCAALQAETCYQDIFLPGVKSAALPTTFSTLSRLSAKASEGALGRFDGECVGSPERAENIGHRNTLLSNMVSTRSGDQCRNLPLSLSSFLSSSTSLSPPSSTCSGPHHLLTEQRPLQTAHTRELRRDNYDAIEERCEDMCAQHERTLAAHVAAASWPTAFEAEHARVRAVFEDECAAQKCCPEPPAEQCPNSQKFCNSIAKVKVRKCGENGCLRHTHKDIVVRSLNFR